MARRFLIPVLLLLILPLLPGGCKERPQSGTSSSSTRPATRPAPTIAAAPLPATLPTTRPTASHLLVNGQILEFPRARLRIVQREPEIVLRLFSDDPAQAIDANYTGNSYYFEMTLRTTDIEQIATMDWDFKARSSEFLDTPDGIFLEGNRKQLQPFQVHVEFDRAGADMAVGIRGSFWLFNLKQRDPGQAPVLVTVQGVLTAEVEGR